MECLYSVKDVKNWTKLEYQKKLKIFKFEMFEWKQEWANHLSIMNETIFEWKIVYC